MFYSTLQNQRNIPAFGGAVKSAQIDKSTEARRGRISAVTAEKNVKKIGSPKVLILVLISTVKKVSFLYSIAGIIAFVNRSNQIFGC